MRLFVISLFIVLLPIPTALNAQEDSPGCKDSPLLTRLAGCRIAWCEKSDFNAAELTMAVSGGSSTKTVEGKLEKIRYECDGKSALQVRRNAESALRGAGFTLDFTGYNVPVHYVTSHKGGLWVAVEAGELGANCQYTFTSVSTEEMAQEMTSNAKAWADEISKTGHVAVYGIEFDTGKATLKPEAEEVLSQVLALLNDQPGWNLRIEGHTDSTGTAAGNQRLSQERAASVVAWLVGKGIAPKRLAAAGLGDTQPVGDNKTPEGRARNRRVELVKH